MDVALLYCEKVPDVRGGFQSARFLSEANFSSVRMWLRAD